jgi:hypothetical protein
MPEDPFPAPLGEPHHHAYVVDDIEATVTRLVDGLGAGPFVLIERVPFASTLSRGEPATFLHDSAFGSCGGGVIELMQTAELAPQRVERGLAGQRPRLQHVGYVLAPGDVAPVRSALEERGLPEYLTTQLGDAVSTMHDASATLGHDLEIHADNQGLRDFFGMVRAAADGWDGADPLRRLDL